MIGASKILTVSYGTFSCTLEGFDDPFGTMKAIAEYFRDLAAEDRYFGAEPPQPDAAMLHRIAEREIQRRVEAKIQDNGVILRAGDALQAQIPAPAPLIAPLAALTPSPAPAVAAEPAPVAMPASAPGPVPDPIAAKLQRIRNAVAQSTAPAPEAPAPIAQGHGVFPVDAEAEPEALLPTEPEPDPLADAVAEVAQDLPDPAEFDPAEADSWPEPAQGDFAPADSLTFAPMAAAPEAMASDDDLVLAALQDSLAADDEDDLAPQDLGITASADAPDLPAEAQQPELDGLLAALADPVEAAQPEPELPEPELISGGEVLEPEPEPAPTRATRARARVIRIRRANAAPVETAETLPEPAADTTLSPEAEADLLRELAELEAGDAPAPQLIAPAAPVSPPEPPVVEPVLVAEPVPQDDAAEAALAAALSAPTEQPAGEAAGIRPARPTRPVRPVRRLRAAEPQTTTPVVPAPAPVAAAPETPVPAAPEPAAPRNPDEDNDAAVSRLLAETNSQMAGPESRRRLSAIAHLKAAVAATVADRRAGRSAAKEEAERLDPYREDLSRIVRETTPTAPAPQRPAPLVLVSEQRVDRSTTATPAEPSAAPIRPRRIGGLAAVAQQSLIGDDDEDDADDDLLPEATRTVNVFNETRSFAEFAEALGAEGLPDLLEAAAAYAACIEGRPHVSRPQLMRQIQSMLPDSAATREDSLRGFGTLLRHGRIVKVRRGQYAISEESHLLAKARKLED